MGAEISVRTTGQVYSQRHVIELARMLPDGKPEAVFVRKLRPKQWFEAQRSLPLPTDGDVDEEWSDDQKLAYYDWLRRLCVYAIDGARACTVNDDGTYTSIEMVPLRIVYGDDAQEGQMTIDQFDFDDNVSRVGQQVIWLAQNGGGLADVAGASFRPERPGDVVRAGERPAPDAT